MKTNEELMKELWEKLKDNKVLILHGKAGTGKTTGLANLIKLLKDKDESYELLATTGCAAKHLSSKVGEKVSTVHSSVYEFDEVNSEIGMDVYRIRRNQNENN